MAIEDMRQEYTPEPLHEQDFAADPIDQFGVWMDQAVHAEILEPNAMTLATASSDGVPSARIVLLKAFDACGFVFYTNYQSDKAADLKDNPVACLCFFWEKLARMVRITGSVSKVDRATSQRYFATRPRDSQLGAWASSQSSVIPGGRKEMERNFQQTADRFGDGDVPTPPNWGGYRLQPDAIEFWQGARSRMHDRLLYKRQRDGHWLLQRLAP